MIRDPASPKKKILLGPCLSFFLASSGIYTGLWQQASIQPMVTAAALSRCCPAISIPARNRKASLAQGHSRAAPRAGAKVSHSPGAAFEWAACQQAAGMRGMFNCRAVHFGGLRHMIPDKSDSHSRPGGQSTFCSPKMGSESPCCSGLQEEAGPVCLMFRASYFSLRKRRA